MTLSDKTPEDKQKLKSGIMGVVILLILGSGGSVLIGEITGVDLETLCQTDSETGEEVCVENEDVKSMVSEAFSWVAILVGAVGFAGLVIAGLKY